MQHQARVRSLQLEFIMLLAIDGDRTPFAGWAELERGHRLPTLPLAGPGVDLPDLQSRATNAGVLREVDRPPRDLDLALRLGKDERRFGLLAGEELELGREGLGRGSRLDVRLGAIEVDGVFMAHQGSRAMKDTQSRDLKNEGATVGD